jgi:hypothetical protein
MQQRPMAVTIFGILNIGYGLFDLLVLLIKMVILPRMNMADNPMLNQMHDNPWTKISTPLSGIAAIVLVAAGIGLLLAQNWARIVSIGYGIYSILACVVETVVMLSGDMSVIAKILSGMAGIVILVYPVLLIIFMVRPNVVAALKPAQPAA